jgi:hypothetical protein
LLFNETLNAAESDGPTVLGDLNYPGYACQKVPQEGVPKVFSNRWCSGNSVKKTEVLDFDLLPRGFSVIWEDANSDHWHFGSAGVPLSLHP